MSIQIENVSKSFNDFQALKDVSLHIPSGAMVALLGPSGSGKTTLLRVIAGLEDPDKGRVLFDGQDITGTDVGSRKVGFVFQHYALFRHMSVLENVAFGLRVRPRHLRPSKKEIQDRCHELLRLVQLDGMADRLPTQLSGGQRQRVALARALAIEPKILLLDEPFGALDARVREELRRWLRRLHDELHVTSVFVTHDQEEALEVADTVVVMNHGKIEQVGTADEVYDQPSSQFVISFLGQVNQIRTNGAVLGETLFGIRSNQVGFVRPHDMEVFTEASEGAVEAVVQRAYRVGPWLRLELAALYAPETVFEAHLPNERFAHRKFQTGDKVFVRAKSLRVFGADAETAGVGA